MPQPDSIRIDLSPVADLGLALDQYCGLWAVEESRFSAQLALVSTTNLRAHIEANTGRDVAAVSSRIEPTGQIALIDIAGTLTKRGSSMSSSGAMVRLRQAVRAAAHDPDIGGILLRIDSPGGTVAGTADLGDEIHAARQRKPVYAFVEDLAASAAYWLAAQADKVYANTATADIGSIGVYMAVYDYSQLAAKEGIEAVVIRSSPLKGAGIPGEKITDEQKAVWQELVETSNDAFKAAVKRGRGMNDEAVAAVATGRVYRASEAQRLGLIDGIQSFDATLAELAQVAASKPRGKRSMAAAQYADIVAACAGLNLSNAEDAQFVVDQLGKGIEADAVAKNWMTTLADRAGAARQAEAAAKADADKAKADAEKAASEKVKTPGVEPLKESGKDEPTSSASDFTTRVEGYRKGGMSRARAMRKAIGEDKAGYEAYLADYNETHMTTDEAKKSLAGRR